MKVRAITPIRVGEEELARRQARYDRLAPSGWSIALEDLPDGAPEQLGAPADIEASERIGVELGAATPAGAFDALMPDCVLDPGVRRLDAEAGVRVLGITRLGALFLAGLGVRFGVLTRNRVIADEYAATIERYGVSDAFAGAYVLDLSVDDIADTGKWNDAVMEAARRARAEGVTVLLNGCSAVEVTVEAAGVRVVDPTALALRVAGFAEEQGLLA